MTSDDELDQAIAEFLEAAESGQPPDRDHFLAGHPRLKEGLRAFFEDLDEVRRLSNSVMSPPFKPGPFGKYGLLEIIGQGGFGIVYKARQSEIGYLVALKAIRSGPHATEEDIKSFRTEARAIGGLDHRNIVPILDFGQHDGQYYFTMRLVEGGSLDKHLERLRGDPKAAVRVMIKVARAVHYAHQRGILHRDLKPANILIDSAGEPYVTDFGLAMPVEGGERMTESNVIFGTLPYMAPERLSGEGEKLTQSVDIWSLGVIFYELLAGRIPFEGNNQTETIDRIRKEIPPSLGVLDRNVPRDLEAICLKCLEKEPEQRTGSALALAKDLERWLGGEDARIERLLEEARRRELRQELLYTSNAVADRVLMKLKDWSGAVIEAANHPELPSTLRRKDPKALQDFLARVRRTFDDPARGLAQPDEQSPFESWFLLDDRGKMTATSPHQSIVGREFSPREWFRGAVDHAGKRGLDSVHVSRVFLSEAVRNLCKFSISVPVYESNEAAAPLIGVLGASFTTDSDLGLSRLHDERHKVVVAGRWDPDSYGGFSPGDYLVLVHPAYRKGEEAVKAGTPSLQSFSPKPLKEELRSPEPGQVGVVVEGYEDPLAERDERFKGHWSAGIAPVGNTNFVAIVQQRPDPLTGHEPEIVVGQLADLTGSTSFIGEPYVEGVEAYTDWLNAQGGIRGKKVRLVLVDYANRMPEALQIYARFKTVDRVVAIQGWGTGDTEALREQVSQDQIPYFSASYSAHLADPKEAPYNFFVAADYSTQLHAGLRYLRDIWKEPRKPKVAFVFPDHPYGKSPIPAGKKFAKELGFEIVGEENVALDAIHADTQIRQLKERKPDFTWIGGSTPSTAVILKDARKLGLQTRFLINTWGNAEDLIQLAGEAAEGVLGLQTSVAFGDDVPGMKAILEVTQGGRKNIHYVRGWVSMMVLCEALWRAEERGELTGPGIKKALETLSGFDPQGLMAPITYTADDHRPNMTVRVYEYSRGQMRYRDTVDVERRPEWLGC